MNGKSILEFARPSEVNFEEEEKLIETCIRLFIEADVRPLPLIAHALRKENSEVLERVAARAVEPKVLNTLAHCEPARVRFALCSNPNTPMTTLMRLAWDRDNEVRLRLATNPDIPYEVLEILLDDDDVIVSAWAAETIFRHALVEAA